MERELVVLPIEEAKAFAKETASSVGIRDNSERILELLLKYGQVEKVTVQ